MPLLVLVSLPCLVSSHIQAPTRYHGWTSMSWCPSPPPLRLLPLIPCASSSLTSPSLSRGWACPKPCCSLLATHPSPTPPLPPPAPLPLVPWMSLCSNTAWGPRPTLQCLSSTSSPPLMTPSSAAYLCSPPPSPPRASPLSAPSSATTPSPVILRVLLAPPRWAPPPPASTPPPSLPSLLLPSSVTRWVLQQPLLLWGPWWPSFGRWTVRPRRALARRQIQAPCKSLLHRRRWRLLPLLAWLWGRAAWEEVLRVRSQGWALVVWRVAAFGALSLVWRGWAEGC